MFFPFLSFLSVGNGASVALKWLANITQASQLLDYIFMCITYIFFYRALKAQGYNRRDLPYRGWYQPYVAYVGMACMIVTLAIYGYTVFLPGWWDVGTFFTYYAMVFVCALLFPFWKILKKTKFVKASECDLVWERPTIDAYEASIEPPLGIWEDLGRVLGIKKRKVKSEE
jgi:amino acid transporter